MKAQITVVYEANSAYQANQTAEACLLAMRSGAEIEGLKIIACVHGDMLIEREAFIDYLKAQGVNPDTVVSDYLLAQLNGGE